MLRQDQPCLQVLGVPFSLFSQCDVCGPSFLECHQKRLASDVSEHVQCLRTRLAAIVACVPVTYIRKVRT